MATETPTRTTLGDWKDSDVAATRRWLAQLICALRRGNTRLEQDTLVGVTYDPAAARALISAATRHLPSGGTVYLSGTLHGNLNVSGSINGNLNVYGSINGNLNVYGSINGNLYVSGSINGNLYVYGSINGNLYVHKDRSINGNLNVYGSINGNLNVSGSIDGNLNLAGSINGPLDVVGSINGLLAVHENGSIVGPLNVSGSINEDLLVYGSIEGELRVYGSIGGDLRIEGSIEGELRVYGSIGGDLDVIGSIRQNVTVHGRASIDGRLDILPSGSVAGDMLVWGSIGGVEVRGLIGGVALLEGSVRGRTVLIPSPQGSVLVFGSVYGGRFSDEVFVGDHVSIAQCDLRQCPDLDRFALVGADLFPPRQGLSSRPLTLANPPWTPPGREKEVVAPSETATIYRRLRTNLESRGNRTAAGVFYTGEMDARSQAAWEARRYGEWFIVTAYRVMSGYGLRAWRAIGWFIALFIGGALLYSTSDPFNPYVGQPALDWGGMLQFSLESMLGLLRPPGDNLEFWERWLQLFQRIIGPVLIAQLVLAIRERVAR